MNHFVNNLYNVIIDTNAKIFNELKIISGYGSATFLEKVLEDYPHLNIELFLGMTTEGISKRNHVGFQRLQLIYSDRLTVYYQVETPLTHIKLYCWYYDSINVKNYAGSANFTNNGFSNYNEILVEFDDSIETLLETQKEKSLLCLDEKIEEYIPIFEDEEHEIEEIVEESTGSEYTIIENNDELRKNKKSSGHYLWKQKFIRYNQRASKDYENFSIPIVLETDSSSSTRGINAWNIRNQNPYLMQSPKHQFSKVFPLDNMINFYTDDGYKFEGIVRSNRDTQLEINPSVYDYISMRIGLQDNSPISYSDLCNYGRTHFGVYKLSDKQYFLDFGLEIE